MKRENIIIVSATVARGLPKDTYALQVIYGKQTFVSPFSESTTMPEFNWGCMIPAPADVFTNKLSVNIVKKKMLGQGYNHYATVRIHLADCAGAPGFNLSREIVSNEKVVGQIDLRAEVLPEVFEYLPPANNSVAGLIPMGLFLYVPLCELAVEGNIVRECTAHIKVGSARDDTEVYKGRESPAWFTKFFYPVSCFTSKDSIEVTVTKKKNAFSNTTLGSVSIPIQSLLNGCCTNKRVQIIHNKKETGAYLNVIAQVIYYSSYRLIENQGSEYRPPAPAPAPAPAPYAYNPAQPPVPAPAPAPYAYNPAQPPVPAPVPAPYAYPYPYPPQPYPPQPYPPQPYPGYQSYSVQPQPLYPHY